MIIRFDTDRIGIKDDRIGTKADKIKRMVKLFHLESTDQKKQGKN
jgi:hypothetical protein